MLEKIRILNYNARAINKYIENLKGGIFMNKKTQKKYVALFTMLAMVICTMFYASTSKADAELPWDESEIAETSTCVVNGVERKLIILDSTRRYLKIGDSSPIYIGFGSSSTKFDQYGTVWIIDSFDNAICWWNYDLSPNSIAFYPIYKPTSEDPYACVNDVESLVLDENNKFVVGYKTYSGQTYPILTLEEMKKTLNISDDNTTPTPTPNTPAPTPNNSNTSPSPTTNPTVTPSNTDTTNVTPTPVVTKTSVKKKAGYTCLSVGSKVTSKYKLTKGKLTWKGNGKSKKFSRIKAAGFIKKSGNLIFMTKKGKVYTLSPKGKKKCILKKGGKKLVVKDKFVTKIKKSNNKYVNVINK